MTARDRSLVRRAITQLYVHADCEPPPLERQVFVASPLTAAIATGLADAVWWVRKHRDQHRGIFGHIVDESELAYALDQACERAVRRGAFALQRCEPQEIEALIAAARKAARAATMMTGTVADHAEGPHAIEREVRRMRVDLSRRVSGFADDGSRIDEPLLREADDAIERIAQAAPDRAGDVAAFLLDRLSLWWPLRGRTRDELSAVLHLAAAIDAAYAVHVPRWRAIATVAAHAGARFLHPAFWIVADRPSGVLRDVRWRAHSHDGFAITWRDGWGLAYLHGIRVAARHVTEPPSVEAIRTEPNAEVRRILIVRYEHGVRDRFLRDARAEVIDQDLDGGGLPRRLLRIRYSADDEPYVAVEVTNTTPEPDGTHKRYLLRVPPYVGTCRQAVAWTFGLDSDEYDPDRES